MIMRWLRLIILVSVAALVSVYPKSMDPGDIIAYPNPFKPYQDTLTIKPKASATFAGSVKYIIYNYNQIEVYRGSTSNSAIQWSGFDQNGRAIPPGIYFVKIIQTNSLNETGSAYIKLIIQ